MKIILLIPEMFYWPISIGISLVHIIINIIIYFREIINLVNILILSVMNLEL